MEQPEDQLSPNKTIYQASSLEVFGKNFLAGLGRALGGLFIYLVFMIVLFGLFTKYALPQIQPFIAEYRQAIDSVNKLNKPTQNPQYQQFLKDLNSSFPINK